MAHGHVQGARKTSPPSAIAEKQSGLKPYDFILKHPVKYPHLFVSLHTHE